MISMKKKNLGLGVWVLAAALIGALALLLCISEKQLFHGTIKEQAAGEHKIEGEYDVVKVWPGTVEGDGLFAVVVIGIGCVLGILLVVFILAASTKNGKIRRDYDERQQLVRGRGFKYGFFTMMICNGLFALLFICIEKPIIDAAFAMTISIMLASAVYVSYCIWNEGYFSLNENPKQLVAFFLFLEVFNVLAFIGNAVRGNVMKDGVVTYSALNLPCAVMIAVVLIVLLLKRISRNREDN